MLATPETEAFMTSIVARRSQPAASIDGYDDACGIVDECAISGEPNQDLFAAVHFLEKNAYKTYSDPQSTQELWDMAQGSWKLQMSTGGSKNFSFHKPPAFLPCSFAMIDDEHFGNGVGLSENSIWISLLHKHFYNAKQRRLVVIPQDIFLFGYRITQFIPGFVSKDPEDYVGVSPPTFVLVGCTEHALIARGNQSGGLAVWTRLPQDVRHAAYRDYGTPGNVSKKAHPLVHRAWHINMSQS
ncbi:MAG: hypothetical protein SGILL_009188 [Bacillariaceae sp.]